MWLDGSGEGEGEGGEGPEESPSSSASPSWRAAVDECPHRLAAMSDGRLEKGVLSCRYHGAKKKPKREFFLIFLDFFLLFSLRFSTHKKKKKKKKIIGWEFGGERGKCTRCPQASDARAEATVLSSPRARLRSFPCKVAQNLLFVWAQEEREGGFENAARVPLPLFADLDESAAVENGGSVSGAGGDWGFQRPPVDWLLMAENSMDPNHAPFLVSRDEKNGERKRRRKTRAEEGEKKHRPRLTKTTKRKTPKKRQKKTCSTRPRWGPTPGSPPPPWRCGSPPRGP